MRQAINGKYYSWSSIRFNFFGLSVTGVTAISYEEADEINPVRAVGSKQIGFTQDNTTASGSITLLAEELEKMQRALPKGKRIQDISAFPITVSYQDDNGLVVSHVLKGVKLSKNSRSASAGSSDAIAVEIPLFIMDIDWAA